MAVIHISEAEAARDLPNLLNRVAAGDQVQIDKDAESFLIVSARESSNTRPRLISEVIAAMEKRGSSWSGDPAFADDIVGGMHNRQMETRTRSMGLIGNRTVQSHSVVATQVFFRCHSFKPLL